MRRRAIITGLSALAIAPAAASAGTVNVRDYGALGNRIADDTAAIELAIKAAGPGRTVYFPGVYTNGDSGWYPISRTLDWSQGQWWVGDSAGFSNLIWTGPPGGTMIRRGGGNSQGGLVRLTIAGDPCAVVGVGPNPSRWPATHVDFGTSGSLIDYALRFEDVQFACCSGDSIRIPNGWWNCWWSRVRWDAVKGYYINATAASDQNLSTFVVDTFTVDMNPASPSKWGFRFDLSTTPAPSGPIKFSNARIEATSGQLTADQATFTLVSNPTLGPQWQLRLEDIAIDKGAGVSGAYTLIRHTGHTNGGQFAASWRGVRLGWVPTSPLLKGNLPTGLAQPTGYDLRSFEWPPL